MYKLCDFGLSGNISRNKEIVGTPAYMAPECFIQSQMPSMSRLKQIDIFAFGILAWEVVHITIPYSNLSFSSAGEMSDYVSNGGRPKYDSASSSVLKSLICSCWDEESDARPTSTQCLDAIAQVEGSMKASSRRESKDVGFDALESLVSRFGKK